MDLFLLYFPHIYNFYRDIFPRFYYYSRMLYSRMKKSLTIFRLHHYYSSLNSDWARKSYYRLFQLLDLRKYVNLTSLRGKSSRYQVMDTFSLVIKFHHGSLKLILFEIVHIRIILNSNWSFYDLCINIIKQNDELSYDNDPQENFLHFLFQT